MPMVPTARGPARRLAPSPSDRARVLRARHTWTEWQRQTPVVRRATSRRVSVLPARPASEPRCGRACAQVERLGAGIRICQILTRRDVPNLNMGGVDTVDRPATNTFSPAATTPSTASLLAERASRPLLVATGESATTTLIRPNSGCPRGGSTGTAEDRERRRRKVQDSNLRGPGGPASG